jgi:CRP-like cAMP-binding protein/FixJ family two-component response regulator
MKKSILVIDDNENIRENTAEILTLAGYNTLTAGNGKQGVDVAINQKPDLIVCDIMMPELDGYGVLHLLRKNEQTKFIPFIFLTAKTERGDLRKGMEMGADDYITKPFDDIELLNAIETRLKKSEVLNATYPPSQDGIAQFLSGVKSTGILKDVSEKYDVHHYAKKQSVYQSGKRPKFLYYILSGKVKTLKHHPDGKEYIIDLLTAGDFLGYTALIEDRNYDDEAVVLEDAELLQISKDDFLKILNTDLSIAAKFIRVITQNMNAKEERLMNLAYSSLRKRVARALLDIHEKFNASAGNKAIEISREDIAQYVGTATESLIRTLSDFRSEKLVEIKEGKILIANVEKLRNLLY